MTAAVVESVQSLHAGPLGQGGRSATACRAKYGLESRAMFVHDSGMTAIAEFETPYAARDRAGRNRALVRGWLYVALLVMFALFLVGGATRLTDSGLSITEWQPIHGVIPPLSDADWQEEFAKYQQIPEYQQLNAGMSSGEFKTIFWWEWVHRILARGVGVVFALPLLFFWATGRLEQRREAEARRAAAARRAAGRGRLVDGRLRPGRSHRRQPVPARHASAAGLPDLHGDDRGRAGTGAASVRRRPTAARSASPGCCCVLVLVQIYLGGLVAGIDGGMSYNTWPLMDGSIVPGDLLVDRPGLAQSLREPEDRAVRASLRRLCDLPAGALAHDRDAPAAARHDTRAACAGAVSPGARSRRRSASPRWCCRCRCTGR